MQSCGCELGAGNVKTRCGEKIISNGRKCLALCPMCMHVNYPDRPTPNCQCAACQIERIARDLQLKPPQIAWAAFRALKRVYPTYDPGMEVSEAADKMFENIMAQITDTTGQRSG